MHIHICIYIFKDFSENEDYWIFLRIFFILEIFDKRHTVLILGIESMVLTFQKDIALFTTVKRVNFLHNSIIISLIYLE
jgi:hypothetical protein